MVAFLAGLAILLQTLEMLQIQQATEAIWKWSILRQEYPQAIRGLLDLCLKFPHFRGLLCLRLAAGAALMVSPHPLVVGLLWVTTVLIAMRWRGTFNGGSDCMTLVVLTALLWPRWGTLYLAVQLCLSFFVAGLVKLLGRNWRNGSALGSFLASQGSGPWPAPGLWLASWLVILWECFFPFCLFDRHLCIFFVASALLFQLLNYRFFGLNRFFWIWLAGYPAVLDCATSQIFKVCLSR